MLEIAVLGLLKEQPLHGYELKKRLSDTLGFLWGVSYGSLYPALRRLERDGAIEVVAEPVEPLPSRSRPPARSRATSPRPVAVPGAAPKPSRRTRKAYRITEVGNARFEELLLADDPHADEDKAFALKLAFCSDLPGVGPARVARAPPSRPPRASQPGPQGPPPLATTGTAARCSSTAPDPPSVTSSGSTN